MDKKMKMPEKVVKVAKKKAVVKKDMKKKAGAMKSKLPKGFGKVC